MNEELEAKLEEFISTRIGKGDSISTAERRVRRIRYFSSRIDIWQPEMGKIYKYVEDRIRKGIKRKSLKLELMDLQHWYEFLGFNVVLPKLKKEPDPDPFLPTPADIRRIREFCQARKDRYTWMRNQLIVDLLVSTGMRAGELIRVNLEDIREDSIYIRSEKGERDRSVPLPAEVLKEVRDYIENFRYRSDPKALLTTRTGRYNYTKLRNLVKYVGVKCGVPQLHPHSLRHYYATMLWKLGTDIREVQILVGHARIDTTTRYTHITHKELGERVRDTVEKMFSFDERFEPKVRKTANRDGSEPYGMGALGYERLITNGIPRFEPIFGGMHP